MMLKYVPTVGAGKRFRSLMLPSEADTHALGLLIRTCIIKVRNSLTCDASLIEDTTAATIITEWSISVACISGEENVPALQ